MSGILSQDSISLTRRPPAGVRFCYLTTPSREKAGTHGAKKRKKKGSDSFIPAGAWSGKELQNKAATCSETFYTVSVSCYITVTGHSVWARWWHCKDARFHRLVRGVLYSVVTNDPLDCRYKTLWPGTDSTMRRRRTWLTGRNQMFPCKKHSGSTQKFDMRSIINKLYRATFFCPKTHFCNTLFKTWSVHNSERLAA